MTEAEPLDQIQVNPKIFGGKPIIRGMRIAVEHVLGMLAAGDTPEKILEEYPLLPPHDIKYQISAILDAGKPAFVLEQTEATQRCTHLTGRQSNEKARRGADTQSAPRTR